MFKSKFERIDCRVCKKSMLQQNYKTHLRAKHPEENAQNIRSANQPTLSFLSKENKNINQCNKSSKQTEENGNKTTSIGAKNADTVISIYLHNFSSKKNLNTIQLIF